jgi:Helix-turn-helix domain
MTSTNLTSHKLKWLDHIRSNPEMLASDFRAAHALASFMGKSGEMFPAVENIARKAGGASERNVQRSLRRLVARGYLKIGAPKYKATLYLMGDTGVTLVARDREGCHRRRSGVTPVTGKGDTGVTQTLCKNTYLSNTLKENTFVQPGWTHEHDDWPEDYKEQFWNAYPRKQKKLAALKILETVRTLHRVPWQKLMMSVAHIDISDPQFIPLPTRWLEGERWDDEIVNANYRRPVSTRL